MSNNSTWNRPSGGTAAGSRKERQMRRAVPLALFVLSVLLVVGAWWLWPADKGNEGKEEPKKASFIREVTPNLKRAKNTQAAENASDKDTKPKELPPQQLGEVRNGYVLLGSGLHKIRGEITNNCSLTKSKYEIFKHSAENTLAGLLSMKAGDILVGEPDYQGSFAESLRRSMEDPIKIEETDTPEEVEVKQAVIEAKEALKAAMERGEDVEKIIVDARRECQDLARAKQIMMADVYHFVDKKAVTQEDVETFVEAANKLLESKGIAPIERSVLADIKLRHKLDDYDPETEEEEEDK